MYYLQYSNITVIFQVEVRCHHNIPGPKGFPVVGHGGTVAALGTFQRR
jgi:hypothetical protein